MVVISVCFDCCFILLFFLTCFVNNGWSQQSNASFTPLSYLRCRLSIFSYNLLFVKYCSSFGRNLCKKCLWVGSELYVRTQITEHPDCHILFYGNGANIIRSKMVDRNDTTIIMLDLATNCLRNGPVFYISQFRRVQVNSML